MEEGVPQTADRKLAIRLTFMLSGHKVTLKIEEYPDRGYLVWENRGEATWHSSIEKLLYHVAVELMEYQLMKLSVLHQVADLYLVEREKLLESADK